MSDWVPTVLAVVFAMGSGVFAVLARRNAKEVSREKAGRAAPPAQSNRHDRGAR